MRAFLVLLLLLYGIIFQYVQERVTSQEVEDDKNHPANTSYRMATFTSPVGGKRIPYVSTLSPALLYKQFDTLDGSDGTGQDLYRNLPSWIKTYVEWHKQQRMDILLNSNKWKDMQFLIMQCLYDHPICGGASDRLKSIPTMLRLAAMNDRLLLIQWQRPCRLEEFILPPKGTICHI
jgi:hypothetical protein